MSSTTGRSSLCYPCEKAETEWISPEGPDGEGQLRNLACVVNSPSDDCAFCVVGVCGAVGMDKYAHEDERERVHSLRFTGVQ